VVGRHQDRAAFSGVFNILHTYTCDLPRTSYVTETPARDTQDNGALAIFGLCRPLDSGGPCGPRVKQYPLPRTEMINDRCQTRRRIRQCALWRGLMVSRSRSRSVLRLPC